MLPVWAPAICVMRMFSLSTQVGVSVFAVIKHVVMFALVHASLLISLGHILGSLTEEVTEPERCQRFGSQCHSVSPGVSP